MFAGEDGPVGVAVSGGPDSVALLHALRDLFGARAFAVLHVNHCLRGPDSDSDEEFVRGLAASLECAFHVRRCDLSAVGASGRGNLEQEGRQCRYRFFREAVAAGTCSTVATGHTRSDQAETVLFRLLRGAGGAGLSGIWPVHERQVVRPMLDVSRAEVLEYLRGRGIGWREDASNASKAFARNRLRHELLPALRRDWNPGVDSALANTADWAVEEERFWGPRIAELRERLCPRGGRGSRLGCRRSALPSRGGAAPADRIGRGLPPAGCKVRRLRPHRGRTGVGPGPVRKGFRRSSRRPGRAIFRRCSVASPGGRPRP